MFGIIGAIISIPIAGCIKVLIEEYGKSLAPEEDKKPEPKKEEKPEEKKLIAKAS
jgi:predicted PurR-regulated permease PerM